MHKSPEKAVFVDPALEQRDPEELQARLISLHETRDALLNGVAANQASIAALTHEIDTRSKLLTSDDFLEPGPASEQCQHKIAIARAERSRHGLLYSNKELEPELNELAQEITALETAIWQGAVQDA